MLPFVCCCCCCCCCCCRLPLAALLLLLLPAADVGQDNILYSAILPLPRLELATTSLELANQQLSLLGSTCLARPGQSSVAASLSFVRTLIRSSDKDLWQTGCIHLDCPCPPIAVLQPPATAINGCFLCYLIDRHHL